MSKFLIIICLFLCSPVFAEYAIAGKSKLKVSGHLRLRGETRNAVGYNGPTHGLMSLKLRPGFTYKVSKKTSIFFEPQAAKDFGAPDGTSGSTSDTDLSFHQGYVETPIFLGMNLKAGRQTLSYGDQLLISPLEWSNIGRSWDALKLVKELENGQVDFFWGVESNNDTTTTEGDDDIFSGLYGTWNFGKKLRDFDLYLLSQERRSSANSPQTYTAGMRAKSKINKFDYRFETSYQSQKLKDRNDLSGFQGDLELGYTFSRKKRRRIAVEGYVASRHYNQLYPLAHKYLGHIDLLGRKNIKGAAIYYRTRIAKNVDWWLDLQSFRRYNRNADVVKANGTAYVSTSNSKDIGSEVDSWIKYNGGKDGSWVLGGGYFMPGQFFKDQSAAKDDAIKFGYLIYLVKF